MISPIEQKIKIFDIDSFQEKAGIDFYGESSFMPLKVQFIRSDIIGIVSAAENQSPAAPPENREQYLKQIGPVKTFTYSLDLFFASTGKLRHRFLITRTGKVYYLRFGGERGVHEISHFSVSLDEKWLAIGYADWVRIYDWEKYFSTGMLALKEEA